MRIETAFTMLVDFQDGTTYNSPEFSNRAQALLKLEFLRERRPVKQAIIWQDENGILPDMRGVRMLSSRRVYQEGVTE